MAPATALDATVRYLRFPLVEDHRVPIQDGSTCPHCGGVRISKWGRFASRQRYRCSDCGRTFSTFTGTALYRLKRLELWRRFLWCMDGRLTVRVSAAVLGVDKDTALRWRHRMLDQWRRGPKPRLKLQAVIGGFSIPHSAKGDRTLGRPARRRGEDWSFPSLQTGPVMVLVAWQSDKAMILGSVDGRATSADYERVLGPHVRTATGIVGAGGRYCDVATLARRVGVPYTSEWRSFGPRRVFLVRRELRTWLRPFHGVASRRLDNYLEWFRRTVARPDQHFPRTAAYKGRVTLQPGGT